MQEIQKFEKHMPVKILFHWKRQIVWTENCQINCWQIPFRRSQSKFSGVCRNNNSDDNDKKKVNI